MPSARPLSRRRSFFLGLLAHLALVFALASFAPPRARADGQADEAELHFQLGAERYREGDFLGALEHFLVSNRLVPNRNVMFNIARTFERLNRFPDAYRYYVDALQNETDANTRRTINEALERIGPNVGVIDVQTTPPGATIYINRRDLGSVGSSPRPLGFAPGEYRVIVELEGYEPAQSEAIQARAGTRTPLRFVLRRILGRVIVRGESGTQVRLDDEHAAPACLTPCSIDIAPGPHILYFAREGFAVVPRQVNVIARQTMEVEASLVALTGSLVVSADERDALIEIDGHPMGFTPAVVANIPIGRRRVRVSLRGYTAVERVVEIHHNQQTDLRDVRLAPIREVQAASRVSEQIEDAPSSVTVISAQELQAFQYPTIYEALRGVRGMALTFDSIYSNAAVRGLGQPNDYNNRLLLLSDGAVLNENILYQAFIGYDGRVDLGDVDRIEVVRGPGSVLYGTGAVSGVVNLVMRGTDEPTSVHGGASAYDNGVARARTGFNLHLGRDAGVWASISGARSDGRDVTMNFDADGDGVSERNVAHGVDSFDAWTTAGKAWWKSITAQWFYTAREIRIPTSSFGTVFDRLENNYDDQRLLAEVRFEPQLTDNAQLLTRAYLNHTYFHLDYLFGTTAFNPVSMTDVDFEQPYFETYYGTWAGAEARLVLKLTEGLRVSFGGEVAHHPVVDMHITQDEYDGTSTELLDSHTPYTVIAGYGQAEWTPMRWLRISAGARADVWNLTEPADDFVSVNPRLAFILKPTRVDVVKIMGGRAFRAPSSYEYFYTDGGITQVSPLDPRVNDQLAPESVYSAELEYSHRFTEDWIGLASVYTSLAHNIIETVPVPSEPDLITYRNAREDQILLGGDLELRREFRGGWMLTGSYGYLEAQYLDPPTAPGATSSTRVPNAPHHYASFRAVVPIVARLASGAIRLTLEAPRRVGLDTNDETDWAVVTDAVISGFIQEYGVQYAVGVYNLFDWQYSLPVNPFASPVMPQIGRSFMLSFQVTY